VAASSERLIEKNTFEEACQSHAKVLPAAASFLSTWIAPGSMEDSVADAGVAIPDISMTEAANIARKSGVRA